MGTHLEMRKVSFIGGDYTFSLEEIFFADRVTWMINVL